jgi:hypothetical protein
MLGRALEALCRDMLETKEEESHENSIPAPTSKGNSKIMLGDGIRKLRDQKIIDDRLYDWSQQLHAFRNLAAHPEDIAIQRRDAEDLQTFANAIVEYVYDLADRYKEFNERQVARKRHRSSGAKLFKPIIDKPKEP